MSVVEGVRQVIQDFLAPELRALVTRIDALEKVMNAKFDAMETKFEAFDTKFTAQDSKIDSLRARMEDRFSALDAKIQHLTDSLALDRRLSKLKAAQQPPVQQ